MTKCTAPAQLYTPKIPHDLTGTDPEPAWGGKWWPSHGDSPSIRSVLQNFAIQKKIVYTQNMSHGKTTVGSLVSLFYLQNGVQGCKNWYDTWISCLFQMAHHRQNGEYSKCSSLGHYSVKRGIG